jgi:hypothetical protein
MLHLDLIIVGMTLRAMQTERLAGMWLAERCLAQVLAQVLAQSLGAIIRSVQAQQSVVV